ncbi:unnamed protein product [Caenorhabditis auriculariae]|uniref:Uncharacterized protein n=1 Tax=Caenorhabditis auriculariae TaxID=2777116 RepID=A0A8S1HS77_9PELO|nr:unnamed protein product [Caenorhabditis auriculariae]
MACGAIYGKAKAVDGHRLVSRRPIQTVPGPPHFSFAIFLSKKCGSNILSNFFYSTCRSSHELAAAHYAGGPIPPYMSTCLLGHRASECPCEGIALPGLDGQKHCWQLESRQASTWVDGDVACQTVGGHLGHPETTDFSAVVNYVQANSNLPVLTGLVAGNVELNIYGSMCPNNVFYDILTSDDTSQLFSNNATTTSACSYIKSSGSQIVFDSCDIEAMALCDRPLEENDYCNIMANCSTTTSFAFSTTDSSTTISTEAQTTSSISKANTDIDTTPAKTTEKVTPAAVNTTTTKKVGTVPAGSRASTTEKPVLDMSVNFSSEKVFESEKQPFQATLSNHLLVHLMENQYQWKILGMCVDWRAMLALLAICLFLMALLCCCHCWLDACMWCSSKRKRKHIEAEKPIVMPIQPMAPRVIEDQPRPVDYSVEQKSIDLPPPPTTFSEPIFIPVPEKHESVYGFHTKEIHHMYPEKKETRDIGVNTDPMDIKPIMQPAIIPVKAPEARKKKPIKKPKMMFIPATIDDNIEDDVPLDFPHPQSPGNISVAPKGDLLPPVSFTRNPKPFQPEPRNSSPPKTHVLSPRKEPNSLLETPKEDFNSNDDPTRIKSPPLNSGPKLREGAAPRPITFSPIADESDDEPAKRIPSPPLGKKSIPPPVNKPSRSAKVSPVPIDEQEPMFDDPKEETGNSQRPLKNNSSSDGKAKDQPRNPFANFSSTQENEETEENASNLFKAPGVGMRAARGKLGGAVRAGGGGGEAPQGWKPWAKNK